MTKGLSEAKRREAFRRLVAAQDGGESVPESRRGVGVRYGLTLRQVKALEREGLTSKWPPLA
jgi:hypothetical protein